MALEDMSGTIPQSLGCVHQLLALQRTEFIRYVVCPSCSAVYEYSECLEIKPNGEKESKHCRHVSFPNHPQLSHRKQCGALC